MVNNTFSVVWQNSKHIFIFCLNRNLRYSRHLVLVRPFGGRQFIKIVVKLFQQTEIFWLLFLSVGLGQKNAGFYTSHNANQKLLSFDLVNESTLIVQAFCYKSPSLIRDDPDDIIFSDLTNLPLEPQKILNREQFSLPVMSKINGVPPETSSPQIVPPLSESAKSLLRKALSDVL